MCNRVVKTRVLVWLCLLLVMPVQAAAIRVLDDAGQALKLTRSPQRIISLSPHLTELLFAVGAGDQLVGVDSASDYPSAAKTRPRIGDFSRVNFERILALKPDLVLVWVGGNRPADIHGLQEMGVPILHTQATRLDDVPRLLRLIGRASGHAAFGEEQALAFEAKLNALRVQPRPQKPPLKVFYQIWDRPLMTLGGQHWISDALALCGARNVFADLRGLSPVVSREAVLRRAPSLIISGSDAPDVRRSWQAFSQVPAVKDQAYLQIDADLLHRPSPRLVDGVAELCTAIRPYVR